MTDPGIRTSRRDPRIGRSGSRPDAVDDRTARQRLQAAAAAREAIGRAVSVSRRHDDPVSTTFDWGITTLRELELVDSDLAGSRISGGLFGRVTIERCRFKDVRLGPFEGDKLDIADSTFTRVAFGSGQHGRLRRSTIRRSTLDRCDLRELQFSRCELHEVEIVRPRVARTRLEDCVLTDVRFAGSFGVLFLIDSTLTRVDFSAATPGELVFVDSRLEAVSFPLRDDCFAVPAPDFSRVARAAAERLSPEGGPRLERYAGMFDAPGWAPFLVGGDILRSFDPEDQARILDALRPHAITEPWTQ